MSDQQSPAQAAAFQAPPVSRVATGVDSSSHQVTTALPINLQSPANLDSQSAAQLASDLKWVPGETIEFLLDGRRHQGLNPYCMLSEKVTVDGNNSLPAKRWKSDKLKWWKPASKMFRKELNIPIRGDPRPSKQETECIVGLISKMLSARHMLITAPAHDSTGKKEQEVKTEPHVTVKVTPATGKSYKLHIHYNVVDLALIHCPSRFEITWVTRAIDGTRESYDYLVQKKDR